MHGFTIKEQDVALDQALYVAAHEVWDGAESHSCEQ